MRHWKFVARKGSAVTDGKRRATGTVRLRLLRLLVVLICAITGSVDRPGSALAHAELVGATPGPGATVERQPRAIRLQFTEALNDALSSIEVWDARGKRVDRGHATNVHSNQMLATLAPRLRTGTYIVAWSAISAEDGHATKGTYTFNLVRAGPVSQRAQNLARGLDSGVPATVARWLELTAGALWLGLVVVSVFVVRTRPASDQNVERTDSEALDRAFSLVPKALVTLLSASVVTLLLQAHAVIPDWSIVLSGRVLESLTFHTPYGELWCVRQGLVLVALALWGSGWGIRRRSGVSADARHGTPWGGEAVADYSLALAVGYDLMLAASGHAASVQVGGGGILGAPILLDWLHVLASGMWVGGIGAIVTVLVPVRSVVAEGDGVVWFLDRLDRFSPLAYASVAILAFTGTFNADVHLTGWSDLWLTIYGRALLTKLGAILILVVLSGISVTRVRPSMRCLVMRRGTGDVLERNYRLLTRSLRLSAALGMLLFLATSVMNTYPVDGRSLLAGSRGGTSAIAAACLGGVCNPQPYGNTEHGPDTSKPSTAPKEEVHMKVLVAALALAGAFTFQSSTHVFANG
jgi:copper transport protein